jgi:Na+/proline symporter
LLGIPFLLISLNSFVSNNNDHLYLQSLLFGLIGIGLLVIALFILFAKGVNKVEGMPAALIIGGFFVLLGFFFLFLGSPSWFNNLGIILGGILSIFFGASAVIWEGYKITRGGK